MSNNHGTSNPSGIRGIAQGIYIDNVFWNYESACESLLGINAELREQNAKLQAAIERVKSIPITRLALFDGPDDEDGVDYYVYEADLIDRALSEENPTC